MKVIRLETQGFKRLRAVDITPEGSVVEVRGNNAEGKTSLLDSIKAALGGAGGAPVKPIRTGDDFAAIRLTLGDGKPDLIVEKYFDEAGEKLRVTNADGAEFRKGQTTLDEMLGRMTFDPLAFARMKPDEQAVELRRLVPLSVDLDALAAQDKADTAARRDVNRDGRALAARVEAINISGIVPERPDRDAIVEKLSTAGETNAAIERERADREDTLRVARERSVHAGGLRTTAHAHRGEAARLVAEAERLERSAAQDDADHDRLVDEVAALPDLDTPVDTAQLSADLAQADRDLALLGRIDERTRLSDELGALRARSRAYTEAMTTRAETRAKALADAEMPVPGLSLGKISADDDALVVMFDGEPFSQASGAQQLRVSMALAMAANPKLRVMLIKDGSLLDANGMALVRELAGERDYQVWLEAVGEGDGTGIIMESGAVRGADDPEPIAGPKRRKPKAEEQPETTEEPGVQFQKFMEGETRGTTAEPTRRRRGPSTPSTGRLFGDDA